MPGHTVVKVLVRELNAGDSLSIMVKEQLLQQVQIPGFISFYKL
jgi:hypothetical protein